jgi:tetratricopeptide (TPR) repeat protein
MSSKNDQFYQTVTALLRNKQVKEAIVELESFLAKNEQDEGGLSIYGAALMNDGQADKALATFKKSAAFNPASFSTHADLGFTAMTMGKLDLAISSFEKVVEINPAFYLGWAFLGKLYFDDGSFEKATKAVDQAETYDPLDADYQKIQAAMQSEDFAGAEKIARDMLSRQPGHPRAAYLLAHLASKVGAHEERAQILIHGLDHHPANVNLRQALVNTFEEMGEFSLALKAAKILVKTQPNYRHYWTLSRVFGHTGAHDKSLEAAEKAATYLEDNPSELGKVDLLRGHAHKILGNRHESEKAYRSCINNTPDNGAGWWGLADLKTYKFSMDDKATMEALANNKTIGADQRCQAAFALARAFENDGVEETSFAWYKRGNDLRPDIDFNVSQNTAIIDEIVETFQSDMLGHQAKKLTGPTPIFILGMPRAGSTLIEQILASHSQVEGTMELTTLPNLERKIRIAGGRLFDKKYPKSLPSFNTEELSQFGQSYLDETAMFRTDKAYFIDKLPPNFERVGLIHKILTDAIIIDARRHPLDCGYSAYKQNFAAGHEYSYNLAHIGHYYNDYIRVMDHWDEVLPNKVIHIQYEDMVRDTEATIRALLDKMGLDFEESCLKFYENKRAVKTASAEQVRQPINTKGMGRWQAIEDELSPLKEALGEKTLKRFEKYLN